ncbi:MAG: hypothetical protein QW403_01980 [Candidatus Aenigmatarchaeota archaeon]
MIDISELVNARITGWTTESLNVTAWIRDDNLNWVNSLLTENLEFLNTEDSNLLLTEENSKLTWIRDDSLNWNSQVTWSQENFLTI